MISGIQWYLGYLSKILTILSTPNRLSSLKLPFLSKVTSASNINVLCVWMSTESLSRLLFAGGGVEIESTLYLYYILLPWISTLYCKFVNAQGFSFSSSFCWWCWNRSHQHQIITTVHKKGDSRSAQLLIFCQQWNRNQRHKIVFMAASTTISAIICARTQMFVFVDYDQLYFFAL